MHEDLKFVKPYTNNTSRDRMNEHAQGKAKSCGIVTERMHAMSFALAAQNTIPVAMVPLRF